MKSIFEAMDLIDRIPPEEWDTQRGEHGDVVQVRFEAYCDVKVYEDGFEERFYIGD